MIESSQDNQISPIFVREVMRRIKAHDASFDGEEDSSFGIWGPETQIRIDSQSLKNLFFTEDWVYIVVNLIAMKISNQRLRVIKKEIVNGKTLITPAEDHPIQLVINDPNDFQDFHSWLYNIVADLILMGNSVIWNGIASDIEFPYKEG